MFYVALVIFIGLAVNAKTGVDRLIYGAFATATAAAFIHFRGAPSLALLPF